ncbi:IS110 family transposase [Rhodococcus opacus]|uniref:Putative transposase for insertion sequence element n=1 Tax=Rhodococcus opacus (strain B4) TaxID=632772 RepID=C1B681_RHOOB|nr:IS110 family transposase [Rhodococcus opacus]BAH55492.1 putative transposase for insertion sequence element [Rhodococcus opacus B4]
MDEYEGKQIVGIDLHRQRSVIVRQTDTGEQLAVVRIVNDPVALALQIEKAGPNPEVVLEATYGWYWAVDALEAAGASVHLAHPLGVKGFRYRRVKNDVRDAGDLADLLRMHRLPEAWIAPPATRELRELVRYRAKVVALRSGLKAQVHAVLAKAGVLIPVSDLFGVTGRAKLARVPLGDAYAQRVTSLLELIDVLDAHEARFTAGIAGELHHHRGYTAIQALPGVGPTLAAVFVAEIGDVHRFADPAHLCSWAGLTPKHRESDTVVHRGHITKQGSKLVRWAAVEAIQRHPDTSKISADRKRIEARRGRNIAKVAAARKLLTLVYYGLRDGHIRALSHGQTAA